MTNPRFAGLSRVTRADAPAAVAKDGKKYPDEKGMEPDEEMEAEEDEAEAEDPEAGNKEDDMKDKDKMDASQASDANANADALAAARAEERQRMSAISESEHFAGREMVAIDLFANTDLPADKVATMLSRMPANASAAESEQMLQNMREDGQADLGQGGEDEIDAAADNHGWGKAHAAVAQRYGRAKA